MPEISHLGAAFAGFLSFFTPCVLPLVPFYLSYMAGISIGQIRDGGHETVGIHARLIISAISFALGVTTIFVLLGMGATVVGTAFAQWKGALQIVAAVLLALFGLHFLGLLRIRLFYREARFHSRLPATGLIGGYITGLAFGFGWTPCVGPALTGVLIVAGSYDNVWKGAALLFSYGIGMTAPFVFAAMFARPFLGWIDRHRTLMRYTEKVMGVVLILFAILIGTGSVERIAGWLLTVAPALSRLL